MNYEDTGGPAFPMPNSQYQGMTLRDWFAGQALVEYAGLVDFKMDGTAKYVAQACYHMADAMLEARK